jgi:hypothetical protein
MSTTVHFGLFPELAQVINQGFPDDFVIHVDGFLMCLSDTSRRYSKDEVQTTAISCTSIPATLILISTLDGRFKGTAVEFWECWDA